MTEARTGNPWQSPEWNPDLLTVISALSVSTEESCVGALYLSRRGHSVSAQTWGRQEAVDTERTGKVSEGFEGEDG